MFESFRDLSKNVLSNTNLEKNINWMDQQINHTPDRDNISGTCDLHVQN